MSADISHRSNSLLSLLTSCHGPEATLASSPDPCGCVSTRYQSRAQCLTPFLMQVMGNSPYSCEPTHAWSGSCHRPLCCYMNAVRYYSHGNACHQPWPPHLLVDLTPHLSPITSMSWKVHCR